MTIENKLQSQEFTFDELRALYYLVHALHGATGRDKIVATFADKLRDVVAYDCLAISLADTYSGECEITHAAGELATSLLGRKIVPGEGISGWVIANRHPFCNTDPKLDLPPAVSDKFKDYRTLAVFPILNGDDLFGAVALYSSKLAKYDTTHQRLLSEATGLLGLALSAVPEVIAVTALRQTRIENSPGPRESSHKNFPVNTLPVQSSARSN